MSERLFYHHPYELCLHPYQPYYIANWDFVKGKF